MTEQVLRQYVESGLPGFLTKPIEFRRSANKLVNVTWNASFDSVTRELSIHVTDVSAKDATKTNIFLVFQGFVSPDELVTYAWTGAEIYSSTHPHWWSALLRTRAGTLPNTKVSGRLAGVVLHENQSKGFEFSQDFVVP